MVWRDANTINAVFKLLIPKHELYKLSGTELSLPLRNRLIPWCPGVSSLRYPLRFNATQINDKKLSPVGSL